MTVPRVAVCGGGVAAIEAVLALREMLTIRPHIDLIAPNGEFTYAPMAVAEPFGLARTKLFALSAIAEDLGAELHVGSLERVDVRANRLVLSGGGRLPYDFAIVAVGARRRPWLPGARSFGGADDVAGYSELLDRLERGTVSRVAYVAPLGIGWTLPVYELVLLTSSRLAERGVPGVELTVVTPEADPLAAFGAAASRMLRGQLADRGIRLRVGVTAQRLSPGSLALSSGEALEIDEVIAWPRMEGRRVKGLPADPDGFLPVDDHCLITGLQNVYAAGDGTAFPIKQGGIASQQADVAAESVAARLGAPLSPSVFEPTLRGMLLTGVAPIYLRAAASAAASEEGQLAGNALWWPPTKIAGRYLGPYLASASTPTERGTLEDRPVSSRDSDAVRASADEARELALVFAEADARSGDFRSAVSWLEIIERLDGVLPPDRLKMRDAWRARATANRRPHLGPA